MRQLALPFVHRAARSPSNILAAPSNRDALAFAASDPAGWPFLRLWVWGPAACGKTHLLHLWTARRAGAVLIEAAAIPSIAHDGALPAAGVAIDDADQVRDEAALLHVLNIAAERRIPLVLASRPSPARLAAALPDLASRLRATLAVEIGEPDDELLDALLVRLLADRQLPATPALIRYLRVRLPREPGALRQAAALLDEASLAGHRRLTTSLAASLLPGLASASG